MSHGQNLGSLTRGHLRERKTHTDAHAHHTHTRARVYVCVYVAVAIAATEMQCWDEAPWPSKKDVELVVHEKRKTSVRNAVLHP